MNPSKRLSARLVQLASIAAAAAMLTACAAPGTNPPPPQPAPVVTNPTTPTPPPVAATPAANAAQLLTQYTWAMVQVVGPDGQQLSNWLAADKGAPVLQFNKNQVNVQNLCNVINSTYATNLDKVDIKQPISTLRACVDEAKMMLERRVMLQLPLAQRYEVLNMTDGSPIRLKLYFSDGMRWEMMGSPTPETRFGSAGDRIFLEVWPEKVACNNPLMRNAKCLRVRELTYDNKGIKRTSGDWTVLQGNIEGYTFEPGIRNVLRLNRYSMAKNGVLPADAPPHAYVLDMIVESERVR
ncbi:DUF4377 domain-containing protein [Diaphorobacter sp. HDW4B]|uniref:DUF4377 domain-containing protein n=1 Tax=Diaphorobacter sp. HDW4B TaxID=2714925 RepID=UPI00140ABE9A|nr:DUF4377 domain-containing protein [Diaphorobacter sp. HDW4B]QIL69401.1 DUF4377 domain-containing protein [Diaphorobacter sp. HDW4B]